MLKSPYFVTFDDAVEELQTLQELYAKDTSIHFKDEGQLEGALGRPINFYHYKDQNTDLFELAALTMEAIGHAHSLNNGNKRLALACSLRFMYENGYTFNDNLDLWVIVDRYCVHRYGTYAFDLMMKHGYYTADALKWWFRLFSKPIEN